MGQVAQCCLSNQAIASTVYERSKIGLLKWDQSDLKNLAEHDDKAEHDHELAEAKFRLHRASFLCQICGLVYADGNFWACPSERKRPGDLSAGIEGTSTVFRYFAGCYRKDHKRAVNPLQVVPLPAELNHEWSWRGYSGTLKDGLLHCSGSTALDADTQALILLRERRETVVIAFRGTEGGSLQDVLTSMRCRLQRWPGPSASAAATSEVDVHGFASVNGNSEALGDASLPLNARACVANGNGKVHAAFYEAYCSVEPAIMKVVGRLVREGKVKKVLCTGHSLGGGVATICTLRLVEEFPSLPVELYTFGGAVVGDHEWKAYFESRVPTCFRLINDQDIIPTLTLQGTYAHVGVRVHFNEVGLWIDEDPQDDYEGGSDEFFTDHKMHNYMRLLDFFQATAVARIQVKDFEKKMQDVWEAYVSPDVVPAEGAPPAPNSDRMRQLLQEYFQLPPSLTLLVEPEILRLCQHYKADDFGYPIFALACAHLFFAETEEEIEDAHDWARRYAEFVAYDKDGNQFLQPYEFKQLLHETILQGYPIELRQQFVVEMSNLFRLMDMNQDNKISFQEYFVFWKVGKNEQLYLQKVGDPLGSPRAGVHSSIAHCKALWQQSRSRSTTLLAPRMASSKDF